METQTLITILSIILPLIGGGIGYLLKHNIIKRKIIINEVTKERREIYQKYVNMIIGIFADSKINKSNTNNNLLKELYSFYKKYVLYASPNVIKAFSDYFQLIYNKDLDDVDYRVQMQHMTKIMLEMRKDLGLKNKGLGKNGEMLMRALITDYDKIWKN